MNKFRMILLSLALLALPLFGSMRAATWAPIGTSVSDDGYALTDTYANGDHLSAEGSEIEGVDNCSFTSSEDDDTLDVYGTLHTYADEELTESEDATPCSLKVDGDVVVDATEADATVNINSDVTFEPFSAVVSGEDALGEGAQLVFKTAEGTKITVNVDYNLSFVGHTGADRAADESIDLHVSFIGAGQTIFKMADGTKISFTGDEPDTTAPVTYELNDDTGLLEPVLPDEISTTAGGVKVFVTMDQTATQVTNGQNKVLFERTNNDGGTENTMVYLGYNTVFTYVSDNYYGVDPDANGYEDMNFVPGGYAAVAIDPSNIVGTGRMVLFIKGAYKTGNDLGDDIPEGLEDYSDYILEKYPFNDGALVIAGHWVSSTDGEFDVTALRTPYTVDDEENETGYDFSSPAGIKAIFRIVDNNYYTTATAALGAGETLSPAAADKRGLLLINDCQNHGKLASDPYWDGTNDTGLGYTWAYANNPTQNVRMGCVLGINGILDVYDHTFLDYVAGSINQLDPIALNDFEGSTIKMKNPAAFIIDGLDEALLSGDEPTSYFESAYLTQTAPVHGQIYLRGNAKALFKCAASSVYGYNYYLMTQDDPYDSLTDYNMWLLLNELDEDGLFVGLGYDGYQLANNTHTKVGEGEHALSVEGRGSVISWAVTDIPIYEDAYADTLTARSYATAYDTTAKNGSLSLATILTDYTGREINFTQDATAEDPSVYTEEYISRPLTISDDATYLRYNSPALFINHKLSLYNTKFDHTDPSKYVNGYPDYSEPAIVGGERFYFVDNEDTGIEYDGSDPDRYRFPEFRLFNSEIRLHEDLCATGVRFVAMDDSSSKTAPDGSNTSIIRFYDHGDANDTMMTGRGRYFVLGSEVSGMGIDDSANFITASAFVNVFKHNKPQGYTDGADTSSTIKLAVRNGNEFPSTVSTSHYERQRASHYLLCSVPSVADAQTGIFLGWTTTATWPDEEIAVPTGDEYSYPYANEELSDNASDTWFKLNASYANALDEVINTLPAVPAEFAIEGNNINFGGYDINGNGPKVPVKDDYDSGNIYVNFGGKFSAAAAPVDVRSTGLSLTSMINTNVPQRMWNDFDTAGIDRITWYSGQIYLPTKQVIFGDNYGVTPSNITEAMFDANSEALYDGIQYARLTPGKEMTFAWNFRDTAIESLFKDGSVPFDPTGLRLLYVGANSDVQQLRVSGATVTDPFYMDTSGDGSRPAVARIREFASLSSTRDVRVPGEGDHALLFVEFGGRIGLGSSEWNGHSTAAWDILGQDYVTICPLGNGVIDVNSDLTVADDLPLIASTSFGKYEVDRLTFQSTCEREIRVPTGVTLDLTSFGQSDYQQQIVFGGNVKLVIEQGASIRFPTAASVAGKGGVVLYFNDQSQLIFEGINEGLNARYTNVLGDDIDVEGTGVTRSKILGKGQIWLNKNAKLKVFSTAAVGVESDDTTAATNVTLSLQRQSQFLIGDANMPGGVFQVGNPVAVTDGEVSFALALNGADALFHTDREGFFGLGAGIVNKVSSAPNGAATTTGNPLLTEGTTLAEIDSDTKRPSFTPDDDAIEGTAWQIIPLYNVKAITITLKNGVIEHKNVCDGSSNQASLWAVGPLATSGTVSLSVNGIANAKIRGGGNILYVPAHSVAATDTTPSMYDSGWQHIAANIWDYAGPVSEDGEMYSVLASAPLVLDRTDLTNTNYEVGGRTFAFTTAASFFDALAFKAYSAQGAASKKIALGGTEFAINGAYVNTTNAASKYLDTTLTTSLNEIIRPANPAVVAGKTSDALDLGTLACQGDLAPIAYVALQQK